MSHNKTNHHPRTSILLLTALLGFYLITTLTIVESSPSSEEVSAGSESLSINSKSSSLSDESLSKEGPLLKFLLRPVEQPSSDNNAAIHKGGEFYLHHKDNDDNNNDSNVSSESDSGEGLRFRREVAPPATGGSKVITTNWGTYEEQAPVVVQSESRTVTDDDSPLFSDVYESREQGDSSEYTGPAGEGSVSYEDYEAGRFEGRQFYPSRGGGYNSGEEQEQSDDYYRQKYSATTAKPLNQQKEPLEGDESEEETEHRPHRPNRPNRPQRPQYRQPQQKEEESIGSGIMGYVQKAKIFYDMFRAMNSAWKTVEDHYRKNGEGIFPEDLKNMNESTRIALIKPNKQEPSTTNKKQPNTKRPKTTKAPITPAEEEEEQQDDTTQGKDEQRSRRSSLHEIVNDNKETPSHVTTPPSAESSPSTEDSGITESEPDLESSETDSSSSTAVAEGRYIKGDPLKGYYDFVITEGSYKFWAVFQVGTAILIIYSTFAAIYYSKVNPLVSDYDYIDYLGGGRSLSDDSDFVDTDAPTGDASSKKVTTKSRQQQQSSAGWFGWVPHAGHTLRFILEAIDKGYNEE